MLQTNPGGVDHGGCGSTFPGAFDGIKRPTTSLSLGSAPSGREGGLNAGRGDLRPANQGGVDDGGCGCGETNSGLATNAAAASLSFSVDENLPSTSRLQRLGG